MENTAEKMTFEESLDRLEKIVAALEKGDCELDASLALFEEGVGLVKSCTAELDAAEQKVKILIGDKEEDFKPSAE